MEKIFALQIKADGRTDAVMINGSAYDLGNLVNVDKNGNPYSVFECPEILDLGDDIKLYSSPCGKERNLPVVKQIEDIKLYGVIYIVKYDREKRKFVSLSGSECADYSWKLRNEKIYKEDLFGAVAVRIEAFGEPEIVTVGSSFYELTKRVNIDRYGEPFSKSFDRDKEERTFEIAYIEDNIAIVSSPSGKERKLSLVRQVGESVKLYGVMYIVRIVEEPERLRIVSLSEAKCREYCWKFKPKKVSMERLYPEDYDEDEYDGYQEDYAPKDNKLRGRVEITFDDW